MSTHLCNYPWCSEFAAYELALTGSEHGSDGEMYCCPEHARYGIDQFMKRRPTEDRTVQRWALIIREIPTS